MHNLLIYDVNLQFSPYVDYPYIENPLYGLCFLPPSYTSKKTFRKTIWKLSEKNR